MVYSDDAAVRERVRLAVGRTPDSAIGPLTWVETASAPGLNAEIKNVDIVILDGEAQPVGGMGIARGIQAEIADPPPTILLIARKDDAWLARWSLADAVIPAPLDPPVLIEAVVRLLTERLARPVPEPARGLFGMLRRAR